MNKKLISWAVGALAVAAAVLLTAPTEPNGNDIILNPANAYGSYTITASGTADDPIVVWGNGATLNCVLIKGNHVIWRDTVIKTCDTFGIRINGSHVQVLDNDVSDVVRMNLNKTTGKCDASPSWHSAIRAADVEDVLIKGNKVYNTCGEGISVLRADGVIVEDNIVFDAFSVNIYIDQVSHVIVRNNYSYSTGNANYYKAGKVARGISIGAESYSGWAFSVRDILIEGNTLEKVRGINFIQEQTGTPSNVIVRGNVFIDVPAPLVSLGSWATVDLSTPSGATSAPVVTASRTPTVMPTLVSPTPTRTRTPTALPPTATKTPTPFVVPTVCETAISDHFWFMGCTK